jgi:thimet oligopeptidase
MLKRDILEENMQSYIDFKNLTTNVLNSNLDEIMKKTTDTLDQVVNVTNRTFENTVQPMINVETITETKSHLFHIASSFYPNKEIRDCANECEKKLSEYSIESSMRRDVYNALLEYLNGSYEEEKNKLTDEEIRYVEHMMKAFKRMGLALNENDFLLCKKLKKELSEICITYQKNVNDENTSFIFTKEELSGMPDDWFVPTKQKDENNYNVTLKYPDYNPAMDFVKSSDVRHKLWLSYGNRCKDTNVDLFDRAVKLRYQIAKLLGYPNHADYKTEVKIIKTGQNAYDFLQKMNSNFTVAYQRDTEELLKFAQNYKENPLHKNSLDPWDNRFYSRAFKEEKNEINLEKVKEYFPLTKVTQGLFDIYQNLLGLEFNEIIDDNKWHPQVKSYEVVDTETRETMGYFLLDLHEREGKYGHAAVFQIQPPADMTKIDGTGRQPAIIAMACNFPDTGCIPFDDVVTFFHEFGHMMHQICSKPQLAAFQGFSVEWDFVEAPSQMLEFWCYEAESLLLMSAHKDNGEPIPNDMIQKLKQIDRTLVGWHYKRQLIFGLFDMSVHRMRFEEEDVFDSTEAWYSVEKAVLGTEAKERVVPQASFGHLMGGYDAGYYGYLRAETYAVNMFYRWFKNGHVLDPKAGMRYRRLLLEVGATKDSLVSLTNFLDCEPDDKYFMIDKGLIIDE